MKKLFMLFLICFCFSFLFGGCETVTPEKVEPTANTTGESSTETNVGTGVDVPQTEVFDIGDVIEAKDMHYTVNSVREAPGGDFIKPKEGNIWYVVDVTIENKGQETFHSSSLMMFKLFDSEGYSYSITLGPDTTGSLDGEVPPGRKLRGEIAFEIPQDSEGLELQIDPSLFGSGVIIVKLDR